MPPKHCTVLDVIPLSSFYRLKNRFHFTIKYKGWTCSITKYWIYELNSFLWSAFRLEYCRGTLNFKNTTKYRRFPTFKTFKKVFFQTIPSYNSSQAYNLHSTALRSVVKLFCSRICFPIFILISNWLANLQINDLSNRQTPSKDKLE